MWKQLKYLLSQAYRLKARDLLGRYHSIFTDKVDMNVVTPVFVDDLGSYEE